MPKINFLVNDCILQVLKAQIELNEAFHTRTCDRFNQHNESLKFTFLNISK